MKSWLRKKMSPAVFLVGAVVSGFIGTASAACGPIEGTWLVDTKSITSFLRPVTFTVNSGGTVANASGTDIVSLGFTDRSGPHGECSNVGQHRYRIMLEELLYKDGLFAGRFLLDFTVQHDPRADTIADVGQSRFKITVFRTTPTPNSGPCISSTSDLPTGDMVREDSNEHDCRSSTDLEVSGRRLATDGFFTP